MPAIINSLSPTQIEAIISAYGTLTEWLFQVHSIVIDDIML